VASGAPRAAWRNLSDRGFPPAGGGRTLRGSLSTRVSGAQSKERHETTLVATGRCRSAGLYRGGADTARERVRGGDRSGDRFGAGGAATLQSMPRGRDLRGGHAMRWRAHDRAVRRREALLQSPELRGALRPVRHALLSRQPGDRRRRPMPGRRVLLPHVRGLKTAPVLVEKRLRPEKVPPGASGDPALQRPRRNDTERLWETTSSRSRSRRWRRPTAVAWGESHGSSPAQRDALIA
jgi:hypothetical protein